MTSNATSQPPDEAMGSGAPSAQVIARGYETTHISIRALVMVLVGLAITCGAIGVGVWYLQGSMLRTDRADDLRASMIHAVSRDGGLPQLQPSGPSHDTTPAQDMATLRASENLIFNDVGWRDRASGSVAVPGDVVRVVAARVPPATPPTTGDAK